MNTPITDTSGQAPTDLLSVRAAARAVGRHHRTLERWVVQGHLRMWRVGPHRRLVSMSEVRALITPVQL